MEYILEYKVMKALRILEPAINTIISKMCVLDARAKCSNEDEEAALANLRAEYEHVLFDANASMEIINEAFKLAKK